MVGELDSPQQQPAYNDNKRGYGAEGGNGRDGGGRTKFPPAGRALAAGAQGWRGRGKTSNDRRTRKIN